MNSAETETVFSNLSPIQREAVEWGDGAFLLLAGPGTGKTRVLTCRAARLLLESPESKYKLLCLTFTNQAADEMRSRLSSLVEFSEARSFVGTFHSFCIELLRQHGSHIGVRPDFGLLTGDDDRRRFFARIMGRTNNLSGVLSRAQERGTKLLPLIERLQTRLIKPGTPLPQIVDRELAQDVQDAYIAYDTALSEENVLDFNSVLTKVYFLLLKAPGVSALVRRTYRYWFIDEFQDTNDMQYRIITALAGEDFRNIFIVADDDQIIYQWNGASHKRIDEYRSKFEPTTLQLPTNHRCPQTIVELANRLIINNRFRQENKKALESSRVDRTDIERVHLTVFRDGMAEANGVAKLISEKVLGEYQSVVVLARTRQLLEPIQRQLSKASVPSRIVQKRSDFLSLPYQLGYLLLRLASRSNDPDLIRVGVAALSKAAGAELSEQDVLAWAQSEQEDLFSGLIKEMERLSSSASMFKEVAAAMASLREREIKPESFVEEIANVVLKHNDEADYSEDNLDYGEDRAAWKSLVSDIRNSAGRSVSLDRFIQEAEMRSKEAPLKAGEVPLMTIHGAKGREFDVVFLVGLADDIIPSWHSSKKGSESPEMEEERRNCFVAITRTKEILYLSFARKYNGWTKRPSRFLTEMGMSGEF